jgi:hypothetical protein
MSPELTITIVLAAVVAGGVSLIFLARWARKRNASLADAATAWNAHRERVSLTHVFFGSRSSIESGVGRVLAGIVILVVVAFLALAIYAIYFAG